MFDDTKAHRLPLFDSATLFYTSPRIKVALLDPHTIFPVAMSVTKLNKLFGTEPEIQMLEEHQGPSKTLKETMEIAVGEHPAH